MSKSGLATEIKCDPLFYVKWANMSFQICTVLRMQVLWHVDTSLNAYPLKSHSFMLNCLGVCGCLSLESGEEPRVLAIQMPCRPEHEGFCANGVCSYSSDLDTPICRWDQPPKTTRYIKDPINQLTLIRSWLSSSWLFD